MLIKHLYQQIQEIINHFCAGKQKYFAQQAGIPYSTLQHNLALKRDDLLVKYAERILHAFPSVRESWLYSGEGEMLGSKRPQGFRTAVNDNKQLVGDLLFDLFSVMGLDADEVAKICHLRRDTLEQVMESSRYPSWHELIALHKILGISIHFLLLGKKPYMTPQTELERLEAALGKDIHISLNDILGIDKYEFRAWVKQCRKAREDKLTFMKKYGTLEAVDDEENDETIYPPSEPAMPEKWLQSIENEYGFLREYVTSGRVYAKPLKDYAAYKILEERVKHLESELAHAKEEIALQRTMHQQTQLSTLNSIHPGDKHPNPARGIATVPLAPGAHIATKDSKN